MVNKSLKKNNLVNIRNYSKKKNLVGGGKKKLLIGFRIYNDDNDTKTYLENKLEYKESNKVDSNQISLLFLTISYPSIFSNSPIFNTRNCVNNLTTAIKLVEDTMSNYLLYRENKESDIEKKYFEKILNLNKSESELNTGDNVSEEIKQILNNHMKNTFSNPLHAKKLVKFSNRKELNEFTLHLIIYPLPLHVPTDTSVPTTTSDPTTTSVPTTTQTSEKYNIKYLEDLLKKKKNTNDMFVVLFPSLIKSEGYTNSFDNKLNISKYIKKLEQLKYDSSVLFGSSKNNYLKKEGKILKASEDYDYGVYTRNISDKFSLEIISTEKPTIQNNDA